MKPFLLAGYILLGSLASSVVHANNATTSSITFPIAIDLAYVEQRANAEIPDRLATIRERDLLCYEGKKAKYDYPCLKGIQIRSCQGWTWVAPRSGAT